MAPQWQAAKLAIARNLPVIISAHGMLEPWLWQEQGQLNRIKKQFYWNRIAYPAFNAAQVIHAITPLEREHLSQLFPGSRIEVIPNGIDTREIDNALDKRNAKPEKIILFIGRLHPKKGTHLILEAFGQAQLDPDWQLVIAGPCEDASYHRTLQDIAKRLDLQERIQFIGPVYAPEKFHLYQRTWITVVPSFSEVVGLVNLESASCNTPTLTTHATGLYNWEEGGNLLVNPTIPEIIKALKVASRWSEQERQERGNLARSLVDRAYSTRHVSKLWTQLYEEFI
jgi:glycosyltransferase involved in cell wall biosynthesis